MQECCNCQAVSKTASIQVDTGVEVELELPGLCQFETSANSLAL